MTISNDVLHGLTEYAAKDVLELLAKINSMENIAEVINSTSRAMGAGSDNARYQDLFYGINRLPTLPYLQPYTENQGLIFFTKPELNLSYNNISGVRKLTVFSESGEANSTAHMVRCALDPITHRSGNGKKSKLTDPYNPYLTYFTNLCLSMNQPPDIGLDTFTTPEGMMKEQWMTADGSVEPNGYYDVTCTMANVPGNPIPLTLYGWLYYIHHLRFGPCVPHPENRRSGRMDYFTRIERYTLDRTGRFVEQWWHCGAAMPKNLSLGSFFAYNKLEPTNLDNKQTTVQFACVGSIVNDPIQLFEFNLRMLRWNPSLMDEVRSSKYIRIHPGDNATTNYYGYPLIDLNTREMTWWIDKDDLAKLQKGQRDGKVISSRAPEVETFNKRRYRFIPYQL